MFMKYMTLYYVSRYMYICMWHVCNSTGFCLPDCQSLSIAMACIGSWICKHLSV